MAARHDDMDGFAVPTTREEEAFGVVTHTDVEASGRVLLRVQPRNGLAAIRTAVNAIQTITEDVADEMDVPAPIVRYVDEQPTEVTQDEWDRLADRLILGETQETPDE
jgi:hypothetical protein